MITDWHNQRVTVMGLGRFVGGVGVTRWLVAQGARVTVTDTATPDALAASLAALDDLDVTFTLGRHDPVDFESAALVVVNPAVTPQAELLQVAHAAGVPVTTEINLFLERCPARTVGVTGTVGKSTITSMLGHILEATSAAPNVWVGGNLGGSLLSNLSEMTADDLVVLELSSFQLYYTAAIRWSPHVAIITNVTPNHLDWHGNFAAYLAAKLNVVRYQDPARDVIIIEDLPELRHHFDLMFGDVAGMWRYRADEHDLAAIMQSTSAIDCDDRRLVWKHATVPIPGEHNRRNAAAALTAAHALGVDQQAAADALVSFAGLPHRLQTIAEINGVRWVDDSKATTPEAVITAMNAFDAPLLLILGGYDKQTDLSPMVAHAVGRAKFVATLGQTGPTLAKQLQKRGLPVQQVTSIPAAVAACAQHAAAGEVVLLSPGCASWGMFTDYRARGAAFATAVQQFERPAS